MKTGKIILLLLGVMAMQKAAAQELNTMLVVEGKTWECVSLIPTTDNGKENYQNRHGEWDEGIRHTFTLQGDTLMAGKEYKRLLHVGKGFHIGLRQEDNRVYGRWSEDSDEMLLYDFGLVPGDTIADIVSEACMKVERVDTITVEGISHRRLAMARCDADEASDIVIDYWVEGIGCSAGPTSPFWWTLIAPETLMLECRQDNKLIFSYTDFGYQSGQIDAILSSGRSHAAATIAYDLQGRRLTQQPQRGLYIRDGKKHTVR